MRKQLAACREFVQDVDIFRVLQRRYAGIQEGMRDLAKIGDCVTKATWRSNYLRQECALMLNMLCVRECTG
jgi:hypothetical protein